jgi:hypothetical protein
MRPRSEEMKRKYAIERFKLYAIFGEYGDGRVSLCMDGRELAAVTKEQAEELVENRAHVVFALADALTELARLDPGNKVLSRVMG